MQSARTRSSIVAIAFVLCACGKSDDAPAAIDSGRGETAGWDDDVGGVVGPVWFEEVAERAGVTFRHELDKTLIGRFQGGVCVLDVDGDGKQDLLFPSFVEGSLSTTRLYMQKAPLSYSEEAVARGLRDTGEAVACVAFDVDGDRDPDVLTVGLGGARLFRNEGGKFVDASALLPVIDPAEFLTAAVAFDADGDGDLDLAIASYGKHVPPPSGACTVDCKLEPETYKGGFTRLLLQRADGSFEDASARLGTYDEPGLVLLASDLDGDDKIDLFVGNDVSTYLDRYFKGDGKGGFTEVGKAQGVAHSGSLKGICSMSAVDGDVNVDGHLDLMESSYAGDSSALFLCKGAAGACRDAAEDLELFRAMGNLRWGQAIVDLDDDGIPELFEASGHLYVDADFPMGATKPIGVNLVEASQLLWFHVDPNAPLQLQELAGGLAQKTGGRGVAVTDLDADGAMDLVIGTAVGRPLLLRNAREGRGNALNVRLRGKGKNTAAIGARVTLTIGGRTATAMTHAGGSYHSSDDGVVHFGLGAAKAAERVIVRWPSGARSEHANVAAGSVVLDEP